MDKEYIPAPACKGSKHQVVAAEPPWYLRCIICGQRFALISEDILKQAGIEITSRQTKES